MNDGKNKFYKTLNLDKETRDVIRNFRIWKEQVINNELQNKEEQDDVSSNI